jgi:hypothetical protein
MGTRGLIGQPQFPMSLMRATGPAYLIALQIVPDIYHEDKVFPHVTCLNVQISAVGAVGLLPIPTSWRHALWLPSPAANSVSLQTIRLNEASHFHESTSLHSSGEQSGTSVLKRQRLSACRFQGNQESSNLTIWPQDVSNNSSIETSL